MQSLSKPEKFRFILNFAKEKKKSKALDISVIRKRGMTNKDFINQQLQYLSLFSALKIVVGSERTMAIAKKIMDNTAKDALLASLPSKEEVLEVGEPFDVLRKLFESGTIAAEKAGCHKMIISENTETAFQFDIHWCVWLELAKLMDIPEACIPNCYADDLAYPVYFDALDIKYSRKSTLAWGASCCDFRFEKK